MIRNRWHEKSATVKKLISKAALLLATTLALPMSAHAQVVWNWSWTGADAGSGTLTTNDLSSGSYLITAMTGTWNTQAITLLPVGTQVEAGYSIDNLLVNGPSQLTANGVGFATGAENVNLYRNPPSYFAFSSSTGNYTVGVFTATQVAVVPEPETYALMAVGLAALGFVSRRRRRALVA